MNIIRNSDIRVIEPLSLSSNITIEVNDEILEDLLENIRQEIVNAIPFYASQIPINLTLANFSYFDKINRRIVININQSQLANLMSALLTISDKPDQKESERLNDLFLVLKLRIVHEYLHFHFERLNEYYNFSRTQDSEKLIEARTWSNLQRSYAIDSSKIKLLEQDKQIAILDKISRKFFIELVKTAKLSPQEAQRFFITICKYGYQEVIAILVEARILGKSKDEAVQYLIENLYISDMVSYPFKVLLPDFQNIRNIISEKGVDKALEYLLMSYSPFTFERFIEEHNLISRSLGEG